MILSDIDIRRSLDDGRIQCSPPVRFEDIRPTGIRLHLAGPILRLRPQPDPVELGGQKSPSFDEVPIPPEGYTIARGEFALGSSVEHIKAAPSLVAYIDGRSTVARLGLMVHCGSVTFDHLQEAPRSVTFELVNVGPFDIKLRIGDPIGLLSFCELLSPVEQGPSRQYDKQSGPTSANLQAGLGDER